MKRFIGAVLFGAILGASLVFAVMSGRAPGTGLTSTRDIAVEPKMSATEEAEHRSRQYSDLDSIEAVMQLPGAFARAEALHAIAGRSSPGRLQALIHDASRINSDQARDEALLILFRRLSEIDPRTAVVLAELEDFDPEVAEAVWQEWSRRDLDAALDEAASIQNRSQRRVVAQALFAAHGHAETPEVARISDVLGVEPDHENRAAYLARLIDESPERAAALLEDLPAGYGQQQVLLAFVSQLTGRGAARAQAVIPHIRDARTRATLEQMTAFIVAAQRPEETVREILASPSARLRDPRLYSAMQALASQDIDKALELYASTTQAQAKAAMGMSIAQEYAREDPQAAIAWAKANASAADRRNFGRDLLSMVLTEVAATSPELALAEIRAMPKSQQRDMVAQQVLMQAASRDPEQALALFADIEMSSPRSSIEAMIVSQWVQREPEAAVSWALSNPGKIDDQALAQLGMTLASTDVDSAMRLLPRIEEPSARQWRRQITQQLVMNGSFERAAGFIERYRDAADYPQLQASIVQGVALTDPDRAVQMLAGLPAGAARDAAIASMLGTVVMQSPGEAVALLDQVSTDTARRNANISLMQSWMQSDPDAAVRWAIGRPAGESRDQLLSLALSQGVNGDMAAADVDRLLEAIDDSAMRQAALFNYIMGLAYRNPDRAERMLDDAALGHTERTQLREIIREARSGSY